MGILKCTIGGTDQSAYLKRLQVSPGGDGRPGSATLTLDKQAAGLTITPRMVVNVWETFDGAGNGVGTRGRLFGGIVKTRDTSSIGTTKVWVLECDDFNIIGTSGLVRDAQAAKAITLTAGTFLAQVTQLTDIIQKNGAASVNTPLSMSAVNNLYASMPAVTYEGGHEYFWYLGQLCAKAVELSPALRPTFFLSTEITVGGSEVFGPPTLWVLDKAAPPSAAFVFTDTVPPPGGEYNMFDFKRKSATNEMVQRQQIITPTQVLTGFNSGAALTYKNPFINHGLAGNAGAWMDVPISNAQVTDNTAAQALIDRKVESAGYPRDSYTLLTDQRPRIGEWVSVTNALEGMAGVLLQVVETEYIIEPPLVIETRATLNARRLRLGQSAQDDVYAPPVEGDRVPPLPPASITKTGETWDEGRGLVRTVFDIGASPSADTAAYTATITENGGSSRSEDISDLTGWVVYVAPLAAGVVRVWAIDTAGNRSVDYTEYTWTAIGATYRGIQNPSFEEPDPLDATQPRYWTKNTTTGAQAFLDSDAYEGNWAAALTTNTGVSVTAYYQSAPFILPSVRIAPGSRLGAKVKASNAGLPLGWQVQFFNAGGGVVATSSGTWTLTTAYANYSAVVTEPGAAYAYMKVRFTLSTVSLARTVRIDAVTFTAQATSDDLPPGIVTTDKIQDDAVDGAKLAPGLVYDAPSEGGALRGRITDTNDGFSVYALALQHRLTSGPASTGTGVGMEFDADTSTTVDQPLAQIHATWLDATHATRRGALRISTNDPGSTGFSERLFLDNKMVQTGGQMSLVVGTATLGTTATDGFLYLPSSAGKPTGTPTTRAGTYAVEWDSTNKVLWLYDGGWKAIAGEGTAFPASPYTGQRFYRSDLMVECYYDGTRWLGPEITIPFDLFEAAQGSKSGTADVLFARLPQDRALFLTNLSYLWLVTGGVHTLGNYWNIVLYRNTNADAYGVVQTSTSDKTTVGSFKETPEVPAVGSWSINPLAVDDRFLKVRVEAVGTPGPILAMPTLKARHIFT